MSAIPQKILRHWVEGSSVAVPFAVFFPNLQCFEQLSMLLVKVEKIRERLRVSSGCSGPLADNIASSIS